MVRGLHKLTDIKVRSSKIDPGRHSDGGHLYLNVSKTGSKSWVFMWVSEGRRREMGLGAYPSISLSVARQKAAQHRAELAQGLDPLAVRNQSSEPTFSECVNLFLNSMEGSWRNEKHRAQWRMTLTKYVIPLACIPVSEITTEKVLAVLEPIWATKSETASRLRGRIERVLDFAKVRGWRSGDNPALWRGHLKGVLPPRRKLTRGHHAAMPYSEVPRLMQRLLQTEATTALALQFLILTAARSGEVYGAVWDEINLEGALWTVPASRMKAGKLHRVPLSTKAVEILAPLAETRASHYVFPGQNYGKPLSSSSMTMLMRRMKVGHFTVHGFRSAFRDWAGDDTLFQREVIEAALAHHLGDATERAYRRADALEKRRQLMQAWASFCQPAPAQQAL